MADADHKTMREEWLKRCWKARELIEQAAALMYLCAADEARMRLEEGLQTEPDRWAQKALEISRTGFPFPLDDEWRSPKR